MGTLGCKNNGSGRVRGGIFFGVYLWEEEGIGDILDDFRSIRSM